ncbi:hypothetical protein SDJN03_09016, partial [Cucurbita argyrosperma subsp. sororia]
MVSKAEEAELNRLETQVDNGGGGAWEYLSLVRKLKRWTAKLLDGCKGWTPLYVICMRGFYMVRHRDTPGTVGKD